MLLQENIISFSSTNSALLSGMGHLSGTQRGRFEAALWRIDQLKHDLTVLKLGSHQRVLRWSILGSKKHPLTINLPYVLRNGYFCSRDHLGKLFTHSTVRKIAISSCRKSLQVFRQSQIFFVLIVYLPWFMNLTINFYIFFSYFLHVLRNLKHQKFVSFYNCMK